MKKVFTITLLLVTIISFSSCKEKEKKEKATLEKGFTVEAKTTTINWIAYKTTSKVPVKGQFTKVSIENSKKSATAQEALNGLKFDIPVSSIFTQDTLRDSKLKKFFFGTMKDTNSIKGTISMNNETSGSVELTMNGVSQVLPITYVISDQMVTIEALMDLDNWQAQLALEALNVACYELHSGPDGISKTWSEVKIEVATYLKYE
ncbi:MAG: YceI family protein [Lutibacter sp.]|uniref:YceI family protein n=1 Tax=Lutibacter sp. TaxID=1925666 RepID=UPI001839BDD0|nr:YceI family protein [Lutibacter sp.]MBT8317269.1 YceI family protein [Lutibacter sp.]NNJ58128.1 YceI family protein [Lutibacter sp.]